MSGSPVDHGTRMSLNQRVSRTSLSQGITELGVSLDYRCHQVWGEVVTPCRGGTESEAGYRLWDMVSLRLYAGRQWCYMSQECRHCIRGGGGVI